MVSDWKRLRAERGLVLVETPDGYGILRLVKRDSHFARISDEFDLLVKAERAKEVGNGR